MNKPFVWPPVLTDEERAERRRLAEQRARMLRIKTTAWVIAFVILVLGAISGLLYLAVLVVRLAWGGP